MPSALSSDPSRSSAGSGKKPGKQETWPTPGTHLFSGADLEEAVANAVAALGVDVEVRAARSVKQGLRGRTHVEVLVASGDPSEAPSVRPLPAPPRPPEVPSDDDPVESTLAALLASADAEEQNLSRQQFSGRRPTEQATIVPFEPPPLDGNPSFAAEFANAFPAALAAARGETPEPTRRPSAVPPVDEFTLRVREALRRVPEEVEDDSPHLVDRDVLVDEPATDELQAVDASTPVDAEAYVVPRYPGPHPAPALFDEPTLHLPDDVPPAPPVVGRPHQLAPVVSVPPPTLPPNERVRPRPSADRASDPTTPRPRPHPGAVAATRPAVLRGGRPATAAWSRTRLRGLGVPDEVLAALPESDPTDDLRWLVALTDAIGATVPAPASDGDADVTAAGRGLRGALALLRLGVTGVVPTMLILDGRAVPATATELALAVRAGIVG
ncbi:MAG: hypothetical protein QOC98_1237 [Frankiaceae bacterium]|nr:hypothetical protein [Frankiaceae bacterium]